MFRFTRQFFSIVQLRALPIVTGGVFFRTIIALVFAKLTAAYLGPSGYAVYGHYYMVASYLVTASCFGLGNAFTVFVSKNSITQKGWDDVRSVVLAGTGAGLVVAVLLMGLFLVDQNGVLLPKTRGGELIWWFLFCIVAAGGTAIQSGILGRQEHGLYQLMTVLNPALSCVALAAAGWKGHVNPEIAMLTYMLGFVVPIPIYFAIDRKIADFRMSSVLPLFRFSLPYLVPSLLIPTLGTISTLSVRHIIAVNVSVHDLGLWQALWRLSEGYMGALIAVGSAVFIPRFSRVTSRHDGWRELMRAASILLIFYLPLAVCFLAIPRFVLGLLLSKQFWGISSLLPAQIAGDILKILCFLLELFFTCVLRPKLALLGEFLFSALFLVSTWLIVSTLHTTRGAVIAYSASYLVVFCALLPLLSYSMRSLSRCSVVA